MSRRPSTHHSPSGATGKGGARAAAFVVIDGAKELSAFLESARRDKRFAFDTEFVMEDRYEPEVCLLQIATAEGVALIDPLGGLDIRPVWELVADPGIETITHAGQEDLALCVQHTRQLPRHVFDVQIAAGFVGLDYPISLQKLVQQVLHIRLHKSKTLTDWRRRPLSATQLQYAAEDVAYLLALKDILFERLNQRRRVEWAREEFLECERPSLYERAEEEKLWRLKGTSQLSGQQLAVVRALLQWRDQLAMQLNRPARIVLKDHLLVEIVRQGLAAPGEIRELRGLNMSDRNVREMIHVIRKAHSLPPAEWPHPRPREPELPREDVLIALATAVIRSYCIDDGLAYSLVASKKSIRDLIRHRTLGEPEDPAGVELLCGWRAATVGALLDEVLAGKKSIHVADESGEKHLRVSSIKST